jgi:hypothetical protein
MTRARDASQCDSAPLAWQRGQRVRRAPVCRVSRAFSRDNDDDDDDDNDDDNDDDDDDEGMMILSCSPSIATLAAVLTATATRGATSPSPRRFAPRARVD